MINEPLMKLFAFDTADLAANRGGSLTLKQQDRLLQETKSSNTFGLIGGIFLLGVAALPIVIMWVAGAFKAFGWLGLLWAPWPIIWGLLGLALIKSAFSTHTYTLQKVQGPINIVRVEWRSGGEHPTTEHRYELHVGGKEFEVESTLADCMMQGDIYAVYYIDETEKIMSVEQLAKAEYQSVQ